MSLEVSGIVVSLSTGKCNTNRRENPPRICVYTSAFFRMQKSTRQIPLFSFILSQFFYLCLPVKKHLFQPTKILSPVSTMRSNTTTNCSCDIIDGIQLKSASLPQLYLYVCNSSSIFLRASISTTFIISLFC